MRKLLPIIVLFLALLTGFKVNAQSEPLIGQVVMFAGNFAPRGWALCNGQLLPISSNTALFSILGTTYGGDGRTNFALPDLRGRVVVHPGAGPGLSSYRLGQKGGDEKSNVVKDISAFNKGINVNSNVGNRGGEGQTINNIQPYQAINYIIALKGVYPSRN
ncbi:phage tail protein [Aestuariibaculum sediminum]|uniref:Phage tail protein n=1 Tax=Aestuariibaculum sediminum TaxID=2770637 RepID=A0A8J6QLQ3_9FLAO|nr:tail fiber protein [Aestuariibaculum sediminum]MBD0833499.1 phage tail protein [Aestuariibaculum sediminum]